VAEEDQCFVVGQIAVGFNVAAMAAADYGKIRRPGFQRTEKTIN
jgi:hypothetical protein